MNKHEEARNNLLSMNDMIDSNKFFDEYSILDNYINECEATEKAYEELKRDVNTFFTILAKRTFETTIEDTTIFCEIKDKLSKVGNE